MIQDDEFEVQVTSPERIQALGFKPQKEALINHILPYTDELDDESNRFLEQVKTNLAKAVMLREMKPACGVWSSRLMKYIRIYGLKFGKEDHIALIKLIYELVLIPDLEPCKIQKFATLFIMLTKKRYLISPDELTLQWRPLYDLGRKIFTKNSTLVGMYHYLTSMEGTYTSMVKCARPYFELSATKEILETYLPQVCPWVNDSQTVSHMCMFLPVALHPRHAAHGHELWLDEFMTLWDTCSNSQCGVSDVMTSFAGLAKRSPGAVDWAPHVPRMFMRFLHAFNLPVSYKEMQYSKNQALYTKHMASWIVWSMRPDGVTLRHLRNFLAGVESYLHSANQGRWSAKLRDLLRKLAREFLNRVRRERERRFAKGWENQTPAEYKLRDEDITAFVQCVLEPTLQAVHSRSGSLDIAHALRHLATLRPALVVPPLVERLHAALASLTEPHRVTAAMVAVAAVARPMLRGKDAAYPEGPTHVVPLLTAVLPGLDPNDIKKTLVTLNFVLIFSWMVPFVDCSAASEHWPDLTEEERLTCESTAQMEDFVLMFLDRVFTIIESSVLENVRLDTKDTDWIRNKTDAIMETAIASAASAVLMQCSPKIFAEALRKFKSFATESTFETNVSGSMVGVLLREFARVDAAATLAAFVPELCARLLALLGAEDALREDNPPRDLVYALVLLMNVVECDGTALLDYIPQITTVLDMALKLHANYAIVRACEILSHIFTSLSSVDLKEWRSSPRDYATAPESWLPVREWGRGCLLKHANFRWHVPNAAEAECAQALVDRYLVPEVARLQQWLDGARPMCRERRLRSLYITNAALACHAFLPPPPEPAEPLVESLVPAAAMPYATGVRRRVTLAGDNVRAALTRLLLRVQARMLADTADDTRGLETLVLVWERVLAGRGVRAGAGGEARLRFYGAMERALDAHGGAARAPGDAARVRMLLGDAARLQDEARLDLVCDAGAPPAALSALHALLDLAVHSYSAVRAMAQARLYWLLGRHPYSYRALVPRLVALLRPDGADTESDEWHARHKGVLYVMLGPRSAPLVAKHDWEVAHALWPAVLSAPLSEKPSIVRLEQAVSETLHRYFPTVNTQLAVSAGAVAAARTLLGEAAASDPGLAAIEAEAPAREAAAGVLAERLYCELAETLAAAADAPGAQWRRVELAMQMLTFCPSVQTPYPAAVVRVVLRALLHDDIAVRRSAQRLAHYALKQRKRPLSKVPVDPYAVAGVPRPATRTPGYRPDLAWAVWTPDGEPSTDAEWDAPWLRDPTIGFYAWPPTIDVAAPAAQQTCSSDVRPEDMEAGERHIHEFFTDDATVDRLVEFLTMEEKKGRSKFSGTRFAMFRLLFAQHGERAAERLLGHALRCAGEPREAPQRFAAEVCAAALRAPRYWPRARALALQRTALDVVRVGLTAVTPDTTEEWAMALASAVEKMDPRRGAHVLAALMELCAPAAAAAEPARQADGPAAGGDASFAVCARLYALQGALGAQAWRGAPLAAELLRRLDAADFVQHPYQNVRETVGSTLTTMLDLEVVFPGGTAGGAPCLEEFLAAVRPRLAALYDENGDIVVKTAMSSASVLGAAGEEAPVGRPERAIAAVAGPEVAVARLSPDALDAEDAPRAAAGDESPEADEARGERLDKRLATRLDSAIRLAGDGGAAAAGAREHARAVSLLSTVLRGCMGVIVRGVTGGTRAQYALVPTACALAARGPPQPHDELPRAADGFLAGLARQLHSAADFDAALGVLEEVAGARSWWARLACLEFAQPLLFYGLPLLCERGERAARAERFALRLMRDARLEVRQAAARLLTGLMHCRALPDEERTLRSLALSCRAGELVERHCGVLGLCAYLSSRPYALGPALGGVLAELARHTSAPDPIPAAIRAALADFRRTHHDDWARHRERLTEDELDLLADLTSPPSYCA